MIFIKDNYGNKVGYTDGNIIKSGVIEQVFDNGTYKFSVVEPFLGEAFDVSGLEVINHRQHN
jgi:hypothetical protein